jgi:hypothetical protein
MKKPNQDQLNQDQEKQKEQKEQKRSLYKLDQNRSRELKTMYDAAIAQRSKYLPLWQDVNRYCRIDLGDMFPSAKSESEQLDIEINDDTASLAVDQATDSIIGILLGDGNFFKIKPNQDLLLRIDGDVTLINDYIEYASKRLLSQINNRRSKFFDHVYTLVKDYFSYGTAGIGTFVSKDYKNGFQKNIFEFMSFSVNDMAIGEGRNGTVDSIYCTYKWSADRIVKTFCMVNGVIDEQLLEKLPDKIKSAYQNKKDSISNDYEVVYCLVRNDDWDIGAKKGRNSAKYVGLYTYLAENFIFEEEPFYDNPINVVRSNKINGQIYGRSDAIKVLSSIKMLNCVAGDGLEGVEKMIKPALGIYEGITSQGFIDTSSGALNQLEPLSGENSNNPPIFPLVNVKDITPLVSFLMPRLENAISRSLHTDVFLDLNGAGAGQMTARESMYRYNIRNKVLFPIVNRFVKDVFDPLILLSYQILYENNMIGDLAPQVNSNNRAVIPAVIQQMQNEGYEWFDIEYISEIAQISKTAEIDNLLKFIEVYTMLLNVDQNVSSAVDIYKVLENMDGLFNNSTLLTNKAEYDAIKEQMQKMNSEQAELMKQTAISDINKKNSEAIKNGIQNQIR